MKKVLSISHCYPTDKVTSQGICVEELNEYLSNTFAIKVTSPAKYYYSTPGKILSVIEMFANAFRHLLFNHVDLIHAHWWIPGGVIGAFCSFVFRVPLIISLHGTDVILQSKYKTLKPLFWFVLSRAATIVPVSDFLFSFIPDRYKKKCAILNMPIEDNLERFVSENNSDVRIVFPLGKLSESKGLSTALSVPYPAKILGGEPPLDKDEHIAIMGAADIVVLPSYNEGFGMSIIEAQLMSKVVIVRNSGALCEIVDDYVSGYLFESDEELNTILGYVLKNRPTIDNIKAQARESARKYTFSAIGKKWIQLIQQSMQ